MKTLEIFFGIGLFIVFYTYIGYGILLYILVKIKEWKNKKVTGTDVLNESELPEVTLLIAAYNEESVVNEKMENTLNLHYPKNKLKVVWVTDGSNDKTNDLLATYKEVEILYTPERKGKTAALNRAIDYIHTPIVVFTDANTMINKEAITEIALRFKDPKVGCVAGEKRILVRQEDGIATGGEGLYWKYESTLKRLDGKLYSAMGAAGELFAVRRELFEKMEEDTLLDDFILSMRIVQRGYIISYCETAYAIETGSANLHEEEKRKVRIAAGGLQSIWRLRALLNPFKYGVVSFQYISHRVLRWSITPVVLFALFPLNAILAYMSNESEAILYLTILLLQVMFYLTAYWGYVLSTMNIKNKLLYVAYYFVFMNINVIRGFFYLQKKRGSGTWEKAKRA